MKYFDIKSEPKTRLEAWERWMNWTQTQFRTRTGASSKRKIEVRHV